MSNSQKGLCPVCRVSVQVKNFKRHWCTHHERNERKRTYDEVFNTLKTNISNQHKITTTAAIDKFFDNKKRQLSEDVQQECITTIIQQSFDTLSSLLISSNIYLNESNSNDYDDMTILRQIFEGIFAQLENEQHVFHINSVIDQNDDLILTDNSSLGMISSNMIQSKNMNDNDALMSLNDLITDAISPDTSYKNIIDNEACCSSTYISINRPAYIKISLPGVQFITDRELKFVDQQRSLLNDNVWLPDGAAGKSKPSSTWFTAARATWLRAVYSEKKYGLLCIICAQEAKTRQYEESELHKQSLMKYQSKIQSEDHGTVIEQLHSTKINTKKASLDYLRAVARSFIFLLKQEFAFTNLKDLIKLQQLNLSEPIVQWLSIANKKELYWSAESRGDWLLSVQKWLWKKQLEELKDVTYITIIADETCDVTVMEQLCICLRYFNPSTRELVERIICLCKIHSQTGEAIFDVINQFLFDLEKESDKKFILVGQCFDGASSVRCQAQGHIRSRINAFAFYVHCRSHLINLSVKDTLTNEFYKSYDLIHRTRVFFQESPQRLDTLKRSQIFHEISKEGSKVPSASDTRWVYHYQLADFMWTHIVSIVSTLIQIHENNKDGSETANGFAIRFVNEKFIYEAGIMKIILGHVKLFLKQTESHSMTFDKFSTCLDSTTIRIENTLNEFDYEIYKQKVKECRVLLPMTHRTAHSTRSSNFINNNSNDIHIDMAIGLNDYGKKFINSTLNSINERFGQDSCIIMDNISMFTKLNDYSNEEVLKNPSLNLYCNEMYYKHKGVNHKIYERTDEPLLCFAKLEKELPQVRVLLKSANNEVKRMQEKKKINDEVYLLDILKFLSVNGNYLVPEWLKLYQTLTTLSIGSNECETSFSALKRIKTKLRNNLSSTALETAVKFSVSKPDVTDDDLDDIVQHFCMYPGRAKA
ncbi:unnamed protein product, partial [Rotaria sordida]